MSQEFLYRIQPTRLDMLTDGGTDEENRIVGEHFAYLQSLLKDGTLVLAGRTLNTDASSFGIAIFRAEDEAAAQAIIDNDPAVKNGVMRAELFPYRVALIENRAE